MPRVKKVAIVAPRSMVDSGDVEVGQAGVATMSVTGKPELDMPVIETADGPINKDQLANLAFAEEPVTVVVGSTTDKFSPQYVQVWVGGRHQLFIRNEPITVKRKFVEALCRRKLTSFRNEEYVDSDGNMNVRWPSSTGLIDNFSLVEDKNPRGGLPWLKKLLAE